MPVPSQDKSSIKIPLRTVLIVPFIIQVILVAGLVGYFSFRNGQQAVNDVAHQLRSETTARITEHLHTFLSAPHQINRINANAIRQGLPDANDQKNLEHYFWEQIQVFDSVTSIYFGNTEGGLVDAGREGVEGSLYVIITDGFKSGPFRKYATDSRGNHAGLLTTIPDFDARTRSWYSGAVEKADATWTDAYILFTGQDMAISASRPVYDEQQNLLGVVSADIFISHISDFLKNLAIGETGQCFIMERSGLLVASSSNEKPFIDPDGDEAQRRLYAGESAVPIIRYAAEFLTEQFGDYHNITGGQQGFEFEIDGQRQFLQVSPVQDEYGIDWLVIVVIPESDFMAQIKANNRTTILLVGMALMIAIIMGIITARGVTGPILRLNASAQALANGKWDQIISAEWIDEIDELARSFNHTVGQLKQTLDSLTSEVAERKQAEEALRASKEQFETVIRRAPVPMVITDANQDVILFNDKFIEQFGHTLKDISTAEAWWRAAYPDEVYRQKVQNSWNEAIARATETGSEIEMQVWDLTIKDGSVRRVEFKMTPLGEIAVIAMNDITDRLQAEEERLKLRKLESVGVLAGGIAHDFNNLLTGLYGNIEMAKRFLSADHKSYRFLEFAGRSMESATQLTKQLLTFAKGGDPIKETLLIGEVITETAKFSIRGSNAKLQISIAPDLWLVEADKGQLSQVISNLVINAQQAMPAGGVITIAAENIETLEGRYVQITIQDEGVGIAPQHLDKIFDPYFSTKQTGSGLGLASVHSIIRKHNGIITADSQSDQGATFTIRLPAAEEMEEKAAGKRLNKTGTVTITSAHVLVLDDEETVREVLGVMLGEMGYKVAYAVDGKEAIAKYRIAREKGAAYDVVIVDLTLPGGMGGQEAAQEILKTDSLAKIIISSGYATDSVMANYTDYGFKGIIAKPYRIADLQEVIQQVLRM